jgi:ParB family chromosome partitioning protein
MPSLVPLRVEHLSPAVEGQARRHFDPARLQALANSLRRSGVREPVIVRPHESTPGHYRIVAGERRWRAAQLAGLTEIPCLVDESLDDPRQRLLAQAEENLHREDLNAVEEASVLVQLMEAFGVDAQEAGALIGRNYQQARRLIQIETAPQPVKDAIVTGLIDTRAALELVRIHNKLAHHPGPNGKKRALAQVEELIDRVVYERWTIRRLEGYARRIVDGEASPAAQVPAGTPGPRGGVADHSGAPDAALALLPALGSGEASPEGPPWRREKAGLWLDTGRIVQGAVSAHERAALIALFEDLLWRARHGSGDPPRYGSPRGERP